MHIVHTCVTPTRTSRFTPDPPLIISPFKKLVAPLRKPVIKTPRPSCRDTAFVPFCVAATTLSENYKLFLLFLY